MADEEKNNQEEVQNNSMRMESTSGEKENDFETQDATKNDEENVASAPYIGIKNVRPNNLNSPYVVFTKGGFVHVVGNFTIDWLKNNYSKVVGDLANNNQEIKLWNRFSLGDQKLGAFGVQAHVSHDGNIQIKGDVDNLQYHNSILGNDSNEKKEEKSSINVDNNAVTDVDDVSEKRVGKHFKSFDDSASVLSNDLGKRKEGKHFKTADNDILTDVNDKKDMSGLDIIPDDMEFSDLTTGAKENEPVRGRKIIRKEAKPSLIKRGIEKFKGLKNWQKVAIVAGVIAIVGIGVFVVGPQIMNGINHMMNPENMDVVNHMTHATSAVHDTASQTLQSMDYSSIGGAGHTVFTNAADATNNVNGVLSNQWFSNNPIDVFNTATNSYMGLTPDQLNDPNFLAELAKDPNNAMLFGNSMSDPSGFIGLDDIVNTVTKIR